MAYKRDQGRMARMAAYWSLAILFVYGCTSLYNELSGRIPALAKPLAGGLSIPFVGIQITGALLISVVLAVGGLLLLYSWSQRPKIADVLIETEHELRKVTWPTMPEAINSSVVVIVTVLVLMAFLAGADWVLGRWSTWLLTGGS